MLTIIHAKFQFCQQLIIFKCQKSSAEQIWSFLIHDQNRSFHIEKPNLPPKIVINFDFGPDPTGVFSQSGLAVRASAGQHARLLSRGVPVRFPRGGTFLFFFDLQIDRCRPEIIPRVHTFWKRVMHYFLADMRC